jgi:hypothetical protein
MMTDRAADGSACHRMMSGQVARHATYRSALDTAMGACNDRHRSGKNRESKHQHESI